MDKLLVYPSKTETDPHNRKAYPSILFYPSLLEYSMMDWYVTRYIYPANGSYIALLLAHSVAGIHSAGIDISYKFLETYLYTVHTYFVLPDKNLD